jgi:hypothetical protein
MNIAIPSFVESPTTGCVAPDPNQHAAVQAPALVGRMSESSEPLFAIVPKFGKLELSLTREEA